MQEKLPLPMRVAWFAPWTWKRWQIVALLSAVYVESPIPLLVMERWAKIPIPWWIRDPLMLFWSPLYIVDVLTAHWFYEIQIRSCRWLLDTLTGRG